MKTSKVILLLLCAFLLNMPLHAQFYTVGTYHHKRIKTNNPPKPIEAPMDSVSLVDSVATAEPTAHENADEVSLVSLPLKSIHINSRFGMRQHPIYHKRIMHNGIDLAAYSGDIRSPIPAISVHLIGNLQYRRQS